MILLINQHVMITLGLANECVKILSFPAVHLAKKQKLHACSQHPRLQLAPALAASTHARSHHDMRAARTGGGAQPNYVNASIFRSNAARYTLTTAWG